MITVNEVYTFKLASGEEFIAKVTVEETDHYVVTEPISTVIGPQGLQMMPSLFSANQDKPVLLNKSSIAMIAQSRDDVRAKYIEATTGITTPSKSIITG